MMSRNVVIACLLMSLAMGAERVDGSLSGSGSKRVAAKKERSLPDAPLRVGGDVKAPVVIKRVEPVSTRLAKRAHVSGIVIMEIVVDREGHVTDVRVLKPLPMGLDGAAEEAVRHWEFRPGTLNGKPVPVIFNVTVRFKND